MKGSNVLSRARRPAVSVVLPTHNRPRLRDEAIASVQAQTLRDFELILVDDASAPPVDATRWPGLGHRLRLVRHEKAAGGAASKAAGAAVARGRFVTFLDDDDLYAPELLARAVAALDARPGVDVLFLGVRWFGRYAEQAVDEQAESMRRFLRAAPPAPDRDDVCEFDERLLAGLLEAMPMDFQRVFVRRDALERIGPHRAGCLLWDCDWALRASLLARCALLREGHYLQRADGQEYFSRPGRERAQIESALEMTTRLHAHPPTGTSPRMLALLRAAASRHAGSLAYFHALHGPLGASLAAWWRSQRLRPGVASARVPFAAVAHAARRRWRQERIQP